jgi:hypothetical protein
MDAYGYNGERILKNESYCPFIDYEIRIETIRNS